MISIQEAFGKAIRQVREKLNLTQKELSDSTGIQRPNIARLERGQHSPNIETIYRIAVGLGIAAAELVGLAESLFKTEPALKPVTEVPINNKLDHS